MKKLNKMCKYFHATDLYTCPKYNKQLRSYMGELSAKIATIPNERKQKFLDYLQEGNIGQAIERIDPNKEFEINVWFTIISDQINTHKYETFNPVLKT